jgi:thiol-disulfide isomerase/thioredoxin
MEPTSPAPRSRAATYAALGLAALVVLFLGSTVYDVFVAGRLDVPQARLEAFRFERTSVPAPALDLEGVDGRPVSLAALKGRVVFVNFWATWCPPCLEEMPTMVALGQALAAKHPGKFTMVAVSVDEGWEPVREYLHAPPFFGPERTGLTVALDPDQKVTQAFYCAARGGNCPDLKFPETYIVDREGRLVSFVVGPRDWSDPAAFAFLESLIGS